MTGNQLKARELKETQRANKEKEFLTKRGQDIQEKSAVTSSIIGAAGRIGGKLGEHLLFNNPEWYTMVTNLLGSAPIIGVTKAVGSFNQQEYIKGETVSGTDIANPPTYDAGIMAIQYIPAIGSGATSDSLRGSTPINIAISQFYAKIRSMGSGSSNNIDPVDYFYTLLGATDLYAFIVELRKVYGCLGNEKVLNMYNGRHLVKSMGYDYDDLVKNKANLLWYINSLITRLEGIYVPAVFPYVLRRLFLNAYVFSDMQGEKSQLIHFRPKYFLGYQYVDSDSSLAMFSPTSRASDATTYDDICNFGNILISSLSLSQDARIMMGDMLKAFGPEARLTFNKVEEDYVTEVVYAPEVLNQIDNIFLVGDIQSTNAAIQQDSDGQLYQGTSTIKFPYFSISYGTGVTHTSMHFPKVAISCSDEHMDQPWALEATRGVSLPSFDVRTSQYQERYLVKHNGTEIFTTATIYYLRSDGALTSTSFTSWSTLWMTFSNSVGMGTVSRSNQTLINYLNDFNHHPKVYVLGDNTTANSTAPYTPIVAYNVQMIEDLSVQDYPVEFEIKDIDTLHYTAICSLFCVGQHALSVIGNITPGHAGKARNSKRKGKDK